MLDEELKQLKAQEQSLIDEGGFYFPQSLTDEAIKGRAEKFAKKAQKEALAEQYKLGRV